MNEVNKKITIQDVEKFEIEHNVKLPKEYLGFLLKFNGDYPQKSTFRISKNEGETLVNEFYGIGDMTSNLSKIFDILESEIPDAFISIADDPGGKSNLFRYQR